MKKIAFLIVAVAIGFAACEKNDSDFAVERSFDNRIQDSLVDTGGSARTSSYGQGDAIPDEDFVGREPMNGDDSSQVQEQQ